MTEGVVAGWRVGVGMREVGMTGRSGDMTKVGVVIGTGDMVSSTEGCRSVYVRGGYAGQLWV